MTDFEQMLEIFRRKQKRDGRGAQSFFEIYTHLNHMTGDVVGHEIYLKYVKMRFHFDDKGDLWDIEGQ